MKFENFQHVQLHNTITPQLHNTHNFSHNPHNTHNFSLSQLLSVMAYLAKNVNSTLRVLVGPSSTAARNIFDNTDPHQQVGSDTLYTPFFTTTVPLSKGNLRANVSFVDSCPKGFCALEVFPTAHCIHGRECSQKVGNLESFTMVNSTMKVFVSWNGEDRRLSPLESSSSLPIHMRSFSFTSALGSLVVDGGKK